MARLGPEIGLIRVKEHVHPDGRELLSGEHVVAKHGDLLLTSHRIQLIRNDSSYYLTFTLDSVASCGLVSEAQPLFLVFAILSVPAAIALVSSGTSDSNAYGVATLVLGVISLLAYFMSRRTTITIRATNGESLVAAIGHTNRGPLLNFLDSIEDAKLRAIGRIGGALVTTPDLDDLPPPPAAMTAQSGPRS